MNKNKSNSLEWYWWALIIIIAVLAILLYLGSFGTVDVTSSRDKTNKVKPNKEEINQKHRKLLQILIDKRKRIYKKRLRVYRVVYFSVRLIVVGIWVVANFLAYFVFNVQEIGALIDLNNALLIIVIALIFVAWGRLTTLRDWIGLFEKRLELWIFDRYIKLPELIQANENALQKMDAEIPSSTTS